MTNTPQLTEKELKVLVDYRANAQKLLAGNPNYFGSEPAIKTKAVFPLKFDTTFEEIGCVGYHPVLSELTATIKIKRPNGYGGGPCTAGSVEYVRFFVDYGSGWNDVGYAS